MPRWSRARRRPRSGQTVQLMTPHRQGPGVPHGVLVGLEDGLFPSQKSAEEPGRLEEERRLAYVGITRAREQLVISYAESRRLHGSETYARPSRFLPRSRVNCSTRCDRALQVSRPWSGGGPRTAAASGCRRSCVPGPARAPRQLRRRRVVDVEGGGAHPAMQGQLRGRQGSKWLVLATPTCSRPEPRRRGSGTLPQGAGRQDRTNMRGVDDEAFCTFDLPIRQRRFWPTPPTAALSRRRGYGRADYADGLARQIRQRLHAGRGDYAESAALTTNDQAGELTLGYCFRSARRRAVLRGCRRGGQRLRARAQAPAQFRSGVSARGRC